MKVIKEPIENRADICLTGIGLAFCFWVAEHFSSCSQLM